MSFATKHLGELPDATAPDGSEVRVLCGTSRGSLAHFTLPSHAVSKAMAHRTVEEVWYFVSGRGQMWRRSHGHEEIVDVEPGVAITIPVGTHFQFRSRSREPLTAVGTTMPPWPGESEAVTIDGIWDPTI
jgi:mannose-6-phosphate isomerase-like protein (cupin superfamily)